MKFFVVLFVLVGVSLATPPYYDFDINKIDITDISTNTRLLSSFAQCFLDKVTCTKEGRTLKKLLPDALKTTCARCSPEQIVIIRKIDDALLQNHKALHQEVLNKFDPTGQYRGPFRKFLESH